MADAFETLTKFVQSPPAQLAAGAGLGGIVWKFFERVEAVLRDDTKLEIAVWLLGVKVGQKVEPWPDTFAKVFDRVFGVKHLSWKCFWRSLLASYSLTLIVLIASSIIVGHNVASYSASDEHGVAVRSIGFIIMVFVSNAVPDYLSLLKSRWGLSVIKRHSNLWLTFGVLILDVLMTLYLTFIGFLFLRLAINPTPDEIADVLPIFVHPIGFMARLVRASVKYQMWYLLFPTFFTIIWLWLFAGSGFVLKAARRFDIGFDWFNRKFDIEKKPLQSIGLVSGCIVALIYWIFATTHRLMSL
jgi:hypothetical protein